MGNQSSTPLTSSTWKTHVINKNDNNSKNDNEKQKNTFSADTMYPQLLVYKDVACQTGNSDDDVDENVKSSNYKRLSFSRMVITSLAMYLVFLL